MGSVPDPAQGQSHFQKPTEGPGVLTQGKQQRIPASSLLEDFSGPW